MAYKTEELYEQAVKAIKTKKLIWIEEIVAFLPCVISTFYDHFPKESKEYKALAKMIDDNRIEIKTALRKKWYDSDNASLQMGLMKLIGSEDETHRLNGSRQEIKQTTPSVTISTKDPQVAQSLIDKLKSE